MTISVSILSITSVDCQTLDADGLAPFDVVKVSSDESDVRLFLVAGKGRAVAEAINAALEIIAPEAAQ